MSESLTRRDLTVRLAACLSGLSLARPVFASIVDDVSRNSEAIHQEVTFKASRPRVYAALTEAAQFTRVMTFSSVPTAPPAQIAREAGGAFSIFGGHIVGRHIELVPAERIVQAWRVVNWDPGQYSIARFVLKEQEAQTTLVFDHTGFPSGEGQHLAEGWTANYWEPLKKYLA